MRLLQLHHRGAHTFSCVDLVVIARAHHVKAHDRLAVEECELAAFTDRIAHNSNIGKA